MLPKAQNKWSKQEARHLLSRAGFGGSPSEIAAIHAMGREKAVHHFLDPSESKDAFPMPEWADTKQAAAKLSQQFIAMRKIKEDIKDPADQENARRKLVQENRKESVKQELEAQAWWFQRMHKTRAPLREKMTLFWHDHFATSIQKVREASLLLAQNETFRTHAFGNFRDLTHSMVRDPAMLVYLDGQRSNKEKPNENFAREIMELFTLGEGHYSEQDIKEAARAFTGFRIDQLTGEVTQSVKKWDEGKKEIFGKSGPYNGKDVVTLIFQKDACAQFLARKLWEFFAYENPPASAVNSLADTLRNNNYEVKPVLREIFLSREFYGERTMLSQIKCPVQYLIQLLKELEIQEAPLGYAFSGQKDLGQVLFLPPNVAGWDWGKAWINTNTLLTRYNIAGRLIKGGYGMAMRSKNSKKSELTKLATETERNDTEKLVDNLIERFFCVPIPAKARESFVAYADSKKGVAFTDQEFGELCHLMLSTPYYQVC